MNIDGVNTLACLCRIPKQTNTASKIYPLPHSKSSILLYCFLALIIAFLVKLDEIRADVQCISSRTSYPT